MYGTHCFFSFFLFEVKKKKTDGKIKGRKKIKKNMKGEGVKVRIRSYDDAIRNMLSVDDWIGRGSYIFLIYFDGLYIKDEGIDDNCIILLFSLPLLLLVVESEKNKTISSSSLLSL